MASGPKRCSWRALGLIYGERPGNEHPGIKPQWEERRAGPQSPQSRPEEIGSQGHSQTSKKGKPGAWERLARQWVGDLTSEGVAGCTNLGWYPRLHLLEIMYLVYQWSSRHLQERPCHFQQCANNLDVHPVGKLQGYTDPVLVEDWIGHGASVWASLILMSSPCQRNPVESSLVGRLYALPHLSAFRVKLQDLWHLLGSNCRDHATSMHLGVPMQHGTSAWLCWTAPLLKGRLAVCLTREAV